MANKNVVFTPQSQNDPRWKNTFLDHSQCTIGNYGCFVTALAMKFNKTPADMNTFLTNGGAISGNGELNCVLAAKLLGVKYSEVNCALIPAPINDIVNSINQGVGVIVEVTANHSETNISSHFVYAVSGNAVTLNICDCWDGQVKSIGSQYYLVINGKKYTTPSECILSVRYFK